MTGRPGAGFELPHELAIDTDAARRIIGDFIRAQLEQAGFGKVLLGLSGGIDSALVAYLAAEAIGAHNVLAVLMPYRTSSPESRGDAEEVVRRLGCPSELVDISAIVDGYFEDGREDAAPLRRGNFMARARMMVLYDHSVTWGGLVIGTGNKTETLIGYSTLWGDSASAFNPIGDLYKSQIRQLSRGHRGARGHHHQGPVGRPVARPDRRGGGRLLLRRGGPHPVPAGGPAAVARRGRGRRLRARPGRTRRPHGRGLGVQAPGAAHRQDRATHRRHRLPLPAPPAALGA